MAVRESKPITPGRRFMSFQEYENNKSAPHRPLTKGLSRNSGRDNAGRISVRRKGGGHKRKYRALQFVRNNQVCSSRVENIEYDPNRSALIALLVYQDGSRVYIPAPKGVKVGDVLEESGKAPANVGNTLPLSHIPLGSLVHAVELTQGKGAQLVRAAGAAATIMAKEDNYVTLKLPSSEMRRIHKDCRATIGVVGNENHFNIQLGKAGRARYLGRRPKVRGVAMNPVDHPHGGGEGRSSGGRHPVSPTGVPTKGYKTRSKRRYSSRYIVRGRKR